jgi:hypothetical protein
VNKSFSHFNYTKSDIAPLILTINILGDNLVGLELGVLRADSLMTILHNCNNVKKMFGVDNWKPYKDYLKDKPDGKPSYSVNQKQSDLNKYITHLNLTYDLPLNKEAQILEEDSLKAVKKIKDKSLDFIFFDAMMSETQSYNEALAYYPKIKKNGYFMGHDADAIEQVIKPIEKVKRKFKNNNRLITYNNCFLFKI